MTESVIKTYNLIFEGKIKSGFDIDVVKNNLKQFFNGNPELVEQLFLKEQAVLKRNLSKERVERYKTLLEEAGICCDVSENIQKTPSKDSSKDLISKKLNDLELVTRYLVKVTSLTQKLMWFILFISILSAGLWVNFYFGTVKSSAALQQDVVSREIFINNWDTLSFHGVNQFTINEDATLFIKIIDHDPNILFSPLPFEANSKYLLDIKLTSSVDSILQLYYSDATALSPSFSEEKSLSFPVQKGKNNIHIFLEYDNLGRFLRLDPISKPGEVTVEKLEIIRLNK